jgi:arylformamidase
LLSDEVIIVEGLDLRAVMPGTYQLTCLPMKLVAADGAPVRAILTRE